MRLKRLFFLSIALFNLTCFTPPFIQYYLTGEIMSAADSSLVNDTITTISHVTSDCLEPFGAPEKDTIVKRYNIYGNEYSAWEEKKDREQMLDEALFTFRIIANGFAPVETTFTGKSLDREKAGVDFIKVKLPTLYLFKQ